MRGPRFGSKKRTSPNGCRRGGSAEIKRSRRSHSVEAAETDLHRLHLHLQRRHLGLRWIGRRSHLQDESEAENVLGHLRQGMMNEKRFLSRDESIAERDPGHLRREAPTIEKRLILISTLISNAAHRHQGTAAAATAKSSTLILTLTSTTMSAALLRLDRDLEVAASLLDASTRSGLCDVNGRRRPHLLRRTSSGRKSSFGPAKSVRPALSRHHVNQRQSRAHLRHHHRSRYTDPQSSRKSFIINAPSTTESKEPAHQLRLRPRRLYPHLHRLRRRKKTSRSRSSELAHGMVRPLRKTSTST